MTGFQRIADRAAIYRVFRTSARGRDIPTSAASELAVRLLSPLEAQLDGISTVCLIAHGLLHWLPLHVLTFRGKPLADTFAVHYAPSAIVASRGHGWTQQDQGPAGTLVVGNPTGDLPFAELEATVVSRRSPGTTLVRDEATAQRVASELVNANAAHIAAHAWFSQEDPLGSGILLAGNGLFTARDAMMQRLNLRRLVLSACSSGQQTIKLSNDLEGLARGFLYAGVQQLVLSLWPVNDLSTMLFMDEFYMAICRGLAVAEALRCAQTYLRGVTNASLADRFAHVRRQPPDGRVVDDAQASALWRKFLLDDPEARPFEHPHYWAPFFVTGAL